MPRKGVRNRPTRRKHHLLVTSPVLRPSAKRKHWTDSQMLAALKAMLEDKEKKQQDEKEQKEKRKKEREEKKKQREVDMKRKAEERAKKAEE